MFPPGWRYDSRRRAAATSCQKSDDVARSRAYRGAVRSARQPRRDRAQLVTEARRSLTEDVAYRQRRYLIMMGIRVVCFVGAGLLFVNHFCWLTPIPAVGAIVLPYFAVPFGNSRP